MMELEYARASQWTMPVHLHGLNVRAFRYLSLSLVVERSFLACIETIRTVSPLYRATSLLMRSEAYKADSNCADFFVKSEMS